MQAIAPSQDEVNARLKQIRKQPPACVRQNCATDAGWTAFLAAHELAPERVESYLAIRNWPCLLFLVSVQRIAGAEGLPENCAGNYYGG